MRPPAVLVFIGVAIACGVSVSGEQRPDPQPARAADIAPVRLLPDSELIPLATLTAGTPVQVLGREGEWAHIQFRDKYYGNRVGYVLAAGLVVDNTGNVDSMRPDARPAKTVESNAGPGGGIPSETVVVYASLGDAQIARSIEIGQKAKGGAHGLFLQDASDASLPTMGALWKGAATEPDLRVQLFTTLAWIRQLASHAAEHQRAYTVADLTAETLEPVLRVVAVAEILATGPRGAAVRHVVLRDPDRTTVVQPVLEEPVSEVVDTADERITREGICAKFSIEDVRELRGPRRDRAFYVTVTRATGAARNFKVTSAQLDILP